MYSNIEFTNLSLCLTKQLDSQTKKKDGIYFTPKSIVKDMMDTVLKVFENINKIRTLRVLEPSCGSGQILQGVLEHFPNRGVFIDAFETNEIIVNHVKTQFKQQQNVNIVLGDFLTSNNNNTSVDSYYDVILGNPPFFGLKKDQQVKKYPLYNEWIDYGRPNVYVLFLLKSLDLLTPGTGILSFVLPVNFLNCMYYKKVRRRIIRSCTICSLTIYDQANFIDTKQKVVLLTLMNTPSKFQNNTFVIHEHILNTESNIQKLKRICEGSTSLAKLGYTVNVGSVVWTKHKAHLYADNIREPNRVPILFASDIPQSTMGTRFSLTSSGFKNPVKKRYIDLVAAGIPANRCIVSPTLVMSRGYGSSGKYALRAATVDNNGDPFIAENHVICIRGPPTRPFINISFSDPRTEEFVSIFCANSALNVHEILDYLPIFCSTKTQTFN